MSSHEQRGGSADEPAVPADVCKPGLARSSKLVRVTAAGLGLTAELSPLCPAEQPTPYPRQSRSSTQQQTLPFDRVRKIASSSWAWRTLPIVFPRPSRGPRRWRCSSTLWWSFGFTSRDISCYVFPSDLGTGRRKSHRLPTC